MRRPPTSQRHAAAPRLSGAIEILESRDQPSATLLADLNRVGVSAFDPAAPAVSAVMGGSSYFFATDGAAHGLFRSDGAAAGTKLVKDLSKPAAALFGPGGSTPKSIVATADKLFFAWDDGQSGEELWASDGTAAGTKLVKDISAGPASTLPQLLGTVGSKAIFAGRLATSPGDIGSPTTLFTSDGTAAGTTVLADFAGTASPDNLQMLDGTVYFSLYAADEFGRYVTSIWTSDGTKAGTHSVAALSSGLSLYDSYAADGSTRSFGALGQQVFFAAGGDDTGRELWKLVGGTASLVKEINPTVTGTGDQIYGNGSTPRQFVTLGGRAYFVADDGTAGGELWTTDGTEAGTKLVVDLSPTVGVPPGTIDPTATGSRITGLTAANGKLYFSADNGVLGEQLYVSDGTAAGTVRLTSVAHTPLGSGETMTPYPPAEEPRVVAAVGPRVLFTIGDRVNGRQLWSTDGTAADTRMVRPFAQPDTVASGGNPSAATGLGVVNGKLLFAADGGTAGRQLWGTDGTANGTRLVAAVNTATQGSGPSSIVAGPNGRGYLLAESGQGVALYTTDGKAPPTLAKRFGDKYAGPKPQYLFNEFKNTPDSLTLSGGKAYFVVRGGNYGWQLWASDGTPAGTLVVKELPTDISGYNFTHVPTGFDNLTDVGGVLDFTVDAKGQGQTLWRTDGTPAGTRPLVKLNDLAAADGEYVVNGGAPGPVSIPRQFTAFGGKLYFVANDGTHGEELWASDGTPAGSKMVTDLNTRDAGLFGVSHTAGSNVSELTTMGGKLYFTAAPTDGGRELWTTDGTAAGTKRVAALGNSQSLWASNPVRYSGMVEPRLAVAAGKLYTTTADFDNALTLWVSDGTAAGTKALMTVDASDGNMYTGTPLSRPFAAGSRVFFARRDGELGRQLWVSDGTAAGTNRVATIGKETTAPNPWFFGGPPVTTDADPQIVTAVGGRVLFAVSDPATGRELWVSDGTPAGTKRLTDIGPGKLDGLPAYGTSATALGDRVLFAAGTPSTGTELWTLPLTDIAPPVTPPVVPPAARVVRTLDIAVTEDVEFRGNLGSVSLPALAGSGSYRVSILWGNGKSSEGTITRTTPTSSVYTIAGRQTFAEPGPFTVTVKVFGARATPVLTFRVNATVADAKFYAHRVAERVTAGSPFSGVVGTIQDLNPQGKLTDFTATIDWGNGVTTAGQLRRATNGRIEVVGQSTFTTVGTRNVVVTVTSVAGRKTASATSAFVVDAPRRTVPRR